jgi:transposase
MRTALSPAALGFTKHDGRRLTGALREESDVRTSRRLQAVPPVAGGHDPATSARPTGFSRRPPYRFVSRYLDAHQVSASRDERRGGRPAAAPQLTAARILSALERAPQRLAYRANVRTVELPAEHLNERYGCAISPRTLRRRMRQAGLRSKRPRYVYSEKEPHAGQKRGRLSGS